MAKQTPDLINQLRASGLRRKVAESVSDAIGAGRRAKPPKKVKSLVEDLRQLADDIEDRATGSTRAKRRAAAEKGARTRRANARRRSEAAKKAARARAKK